MITKEYPTRDEWLTARMGKITGSKLGDILVKRGNGKKIGYYQLIAERLAIPDAGDLSPMERGSFLETEALERFQEDSGKTVDMRRLLWCRDDNEAIAYSPDGVIGETEAVEVKCLSSARHIEALLTNAVPKDYEEQIVQAFIVNETLETVYMVFFDPRMTVKEFFYLTIKRENVQELVEKYLAFERTTLAEIDAIVNQLMDF